MLESTESCQSVQYEYYGENTYAVVHSITEAVVAWYVQKRAPETPREDLYQDGWRVALESLPTFRPDVGNLRSYLYTIVKRELGKNTSAALTPVSIHSHVELARDLQQRTEVTEDLLVTEYTPEDALLDHEMVYQRQRWNIGHRRMLDRILAAFSTDDAAIVRRYHGLDGENPASARTIAESLDGDRRHVSSVIERFRRRMAGDRDARVLSDALEELIDEA